MRFIVLSLSLSLVVSRSTLGQVLDTTQVTSTFSGSVGITNNGFSIVPTFSLNSPAVITNLFFRKKRFSFDPDIRLVPDARKGNMLFWFRYYLVERQKFTLRVGAHPAFSFVRRTLVDNGQSRELTELLRFAAFEVVPTYRIKPNWSIGAVYLNGNGLQPYGPQHTNVLFLNTSLSNIRLSNQTRLHLIPTVFILNVDGNSGSYFSGTAILSRKDLPFTLQSTINQTFTSDIPGNQNFMWNVLLAYTFNKKFKRVP